MRDILVVTSFNERLFKEYAHRWLASVGNWPSNAKHIVYAEDFTPPKVDGVEVRDLHKCCPDLVAFKEQYAGKSSTDWRWNATKFANKVYAAAHALRNHDGMGIWLDADCITYEKIPDDLLETLIPEGNYLAFFRRSSMYTETGFWAVDCSHPMNKAFLSAFEGVYNSGEIFLQPEWHDCVAFDLVRKRFQDKGMRTHNLTPKQYPQLHPMSVSVLAPYIDHCKGPSRKKLGYSPEYGNRAAGKKPVEVTYKSKKRFWTKNEPLPSEEEIAELEGYRAYEDGFKDDACPYKDEKFASRWRAGWDKHLQEFIQENQWA